MTDHPHASECTFCRIAARELPASIVYASDDVVAFRDANPKAPTHILIIPTDHITSVAEVTEAYGPVLVEMLEVAGHLARAEGIDETGWRLVANTGPDAGQSVFHLHLHLLGGRRMGWPPG
jgi:histidine triad (HIT) family protein